MSFHACPSMACYLSGHNLPQDDQADMTHLADQWQPRAPVDPPTPEVTPWTYTGGDPAIDLFTAAVSRFGMTFPPHSRILELGCAETDFLERLHAWDPTFDLVGVDARAQSRLATGFTLIHANAMQPDLFEPDTFQRILLLGALEHFGLGFYGDAVHDAGDTITMQNVARWLRPGGFVYFDVPCQPTFLVSPDRCFRMYAPGSIQERLLVDGLQEVNRAYSLPEPWAGTWCHAPTEERVPYWFVAVLAQKPL